MQHSGVLQDKDILHVQHISVHIQTIIRHDIQDNKTQNYHI
jgi:hypothetical protein